MNGWDYLDGGIKWEGLWNKKLSNFNYLEGKVEQKNSRYLGRIESQGKDSQMCVVSTGTHNFWDGRVVNIKEIEQDDNWKKKYLMNLMTGRLMVFLE